MEQYLNLVWKNYTASLSRNSDDENFSGEQDDGKSIIFLPSSINYLSQASGTFAGSDLHYKIPFWIGVIVISLLFLSAIIAAIRYCFYTLCSSHTGKFSTFHTFFIVIELHHIKSISIQTFHSNTNKRE
jgi:hypothetical protein